MTLIILASLLLSSHAQTNEPLTLIPQRESVSDVLSSLQSPDPRRKSEALGAIEENAALRQDTRVRQAVLAELENARAQYVERRRSGRGDHRAGEFFLALISTTAKFDGPEVETALLPYLGQSPIAQRRVAASGSRMVDDLLLLYQSGTGATDPESVRFGALLTLAEITARNTLSPKQRSNVEQVAADALESQETFVYAGGIYLAAATRRPDLVDVAVKARDGDFGNRRVAENDRPFLKDVGHRALVQAGIAVR